MDIKKLESIAYRMRVNCVRMTTAAGSGHLTSALSAVDLVAALFFHAMGRDDKFVLSKGHASPVLYAAWKEQGLITEQELLTYRQFDSVLEGHPTTRCKYVDVATGSLGQGLSMGLGMVLASRIDNNERKVWVLMGDSEVSEGSVWEAAQVARYYQANNLIGILDVNRLGQTGPTMEGDDLARHQAMWHGFGWKTIVINGHDMGEIVKAYEHISGDSPTIIIAGTKKGFGVDLVEDKLGWHGKALTKEQEKTALEQLARRFK